MVDNLNQQTAIKPWYFRWWGISVAFLLVVLLVWLIGLNMWLFNPNPFPENQPSDFNPLTTDIDDDPSFGSLDSKLTIIAFEDFTCTACAEGYLAIKQLRENYADQIHFVFRDFPIVGNNSTTAAMAGECADDQGKFWEMHDKLYENQDLISQEYVRAFASQLDLDLTEFNNCINENKHGAEIRNDFNEGLAAGVIATPTWFINGEALAGAFSYEIWQQIIDSY